MTVRSPRGYVNVLGQTVQCEEISIQMSRDAKTDTLNGKAALYGGGPDAAFWSSASDMAIQATISDGAGKSAQLFDGYVDNVDVDFTAGTVSFSARDKSAKMLDKKSSKKHLNKKPHEIVQDYAGQSGIPADAESVDEKAGRTFQIDYVALVHRMSDWHAVQHVAEAHGMTAYATNGRLYFKKIPEDLPTFALQFTRPTSGSPAQANTVKLQCTRNVQLGKNIKTKVHSWNHKNQKQYDGEADEPGGGGDLTYEYHHPGLTQDQVNKRAKAHLDKATKHELGVRADIPGDPTVNARMNLLLSGTNSAWDQIHEIQSVTHKIDWSGGYVTSIDSKSKSKKRGG